jgi:hypothetical protein
MAMGKPMKGLLLIAGKPSNGGPMPGDEEEPPDSESPAGGGSGLEERALSDAFDAAKNGELDRFKSSMIRAIRACVIKEMGEKY